MNDLFHIILRHLFANDSLHQDQDLNDLLSKWLGENFDNANSLFFIERTLTLLGKNDFILLLAHPDLGTPTGGRTPRKYIGLNEGRVVVRLLFKGHNYIEKIIRGENQESFLRRQTEANEAAAAQNIAVSNSVITTNRTVTSNLAFQKALTIISVGVAFLSVVVLIIYTYYTAKGITADQLNETNRILLKQVSTFDSTKIFQRSLDKPINKLLKDSIVKNKGAIIK